MYNKYRSYSLGELISIIEHAALDLMSEPVISEKKADGTLMNLTEVANHNSMIAMNNAGIRLLANALIDELRGPAEEEADQGG